MGYGVKSTLTNVVIKKENFEKLFGVLSEEGLFPDETVADALEGLIEDWFYFETLFKSNGDMWITDDYSENLRNQIDFFNKIAPYVEDGGEAHYRGEDGDQWKWVFRNGKLVTLYPQITWVEKE
jgi:hypothetical protein